jgi:hypothetical protein
VPSSIEKTIRGLAKDYYDGMISRSHYRSKRAALLNELIGDVQEYPFGEDDTTTQPRSKVVTPQGKPSLQKNESRWPASLVTAIIAITVVIILIVQFLKLNSTPEPLLTVDSEQVMAVQQLVESFLAQDDWGTDALVQFVHVWNEVAQPTQNQARQRVWFNKLEQELQAHILEQRTVTDAKSSGARSEQEMLLVTFGEHLGIETP